MHGESFPREYLMVICGNQTQMKVVIWTVYLCELVCGWGGLSGLYRGVKTFGGLGMQDQHNESSVTRFIHQRGKVTRKVYI